MNKIINRIFSAKYVNHIAVANNAILMVMYRFAYPFAYLLNKLHLSPNQITTQSLVFTILAFIALIYDKGWGLFSLFWGMAVLLDFCDGTVARMANKVSKSAFRYDHMSDIFKIYLVTLGVGIRYDNLLFWILSSTLIFSYTYSEILSHDLKNIMTQKQNDDSTSSPSNGKAEKRRIRERFVLAGVVVEKFPLMVSVVRNTFAAIIGFNGHTLLVFFTFPIGGWVTMVALIYLISLTAMSSISGINSLRRISR